MTTFYIDSSALVALLFEEPAHTEIEKVFKNNRGSNELITCNLTEAEVLSAAKREKTSLDMACKLLGCLSIVYPDRCLVEELTGLLSATYCKGADAYHIACALFLNPKADQLVFLTLDMEQRKAATRAGFTCFR